MSLIYNRLYKVPAWIVVDLPKDVAKTLIEEFKAAGAHEMRLIADSFPLTVNEMAGKGWAHEVHKPMPFNANPDFVFFSIAHHIKKLGLNKTLSGTPEKPISTLNRRIESGDDYVRLFNDVMSNEPPITLSHIFGIGELCHQDGSSIKTFISCGPAPIKVLQKVSDRVITVGAGKDGLIVEGCDKEDVIYEAVFSFAKQCGYMP